MKATHLQHQFKVIQNKLAGVVNYNEIEFLQLYEFIDEYVEISNEYARLKGKYIDIHQRNLNLRELVIDLKDKKQPINYRRDIFKRIKIHLNQNITDFNSNLIYHNSI